MFVYLVGRGGGETHGPAGAGVADSYSRTPVKPRGGQHLERGLGFMQQLLLERAGPLSSF